jgi:hypothetical protein
MECVACECSGPYEQVLNGANVEVMSTKLGIWTPFANDSQPCMRYVRHFYHIFQTKKSKN